MRDPRIDPRPGDVLAKRKFVRVLSIIPLGPRATPYVRTFEVYKEYAIDRRDIPNYGYYLSSFRRWAKNARVIRTAEESEAA